jgi:hypothetical protein
VIERSVDDLAAVNARLGVPKAAEACHTAVVDGYVIEGHVPADVIRRIIKDRPDIIGVAVPGMPTGAPGMEGPKTLYEIMTWDKTGKLKVLEKRK